MAVTFRLTAEQVAVIQPPVYLDREGALEGAVRPAAGLLAAPRTSAVLSGSRRSQGRLIGRPRDITNLEG